jgi:hypothetical protein
VDPRDSEAVEAWYQKTLPTLPAAEAEAIIEELVAGEGLEEERGGPRRYPDRRTTPALGEALPAREPMLAALFSRLVALASRRG